MKRAFLVVVDLDEDDTLEDVEYMLYRALKHADVEFVTLPEGFEVERWMPPAKAWGER